MTPPPSKRDPAVPLTRFRDFTDDELERIIAGLEKYSVPITVKPLLREAAAEQFLRDPDRLGP